MEYGNISMLVSVIFMLLILIFRMKNRIHNMRIDLVSVVNKLKKISNEKNREKKKRAKHYR